MDGQTSIGAAISAYVAAVKDGSFPAQEHCF
jgi:3-methyl-2-oxobutanoate hydroxymethyltransferase